MFSAYNLYEYQPTAKSNCLVLTLSKHPCRALSDGAERTASVGEEGKEERRAYAAIYKRDYYVNNVDGNDNDNDDGSSGDEDEIPQKKVDISYLILIHFLLALRAFSLGWHC